MTRANNKVKYVACLESLWDEDGVQSEKRASVIPILDLLSKVEEDFKSRERSLGTICKVYPSFTGFGIH